MARSLRVLVVLVAAIASAACALSPIAQTSPQLTPSQPPSATPTLRPSTRPAVSPGCGQLLGDVVLAETIACAPTPTPPPSELPPPEYTAFPDPPGTFADCRPYAGGPIHTPTPQPDATPGPTLDVGALVPCGREEWRQALDPVVRTVGRDKRNFADSYFPVTVVEPGSWRLVINFVEGGDPSARAKVEALIQAGAPVEWRVVKYSYAQLQHLQEGPLWQVLGADASEKLDSTGIDVVNDVVVVTTRGPQPELKSQLEQQFGDEILVIEGPAEPPQPI